MKKPCASSSVATTMVADPELCGFMAQREQRMNELKARMALHDLAALKVVKRKYAARKVQIKVLDEDGKQVVRQSKRLKLGAASWCVLDAMQTQDSAFWWGMFRAGWFHLEVKDVPDSVWGASDVSTVLQFQL